MNIRLERAQMLSYSLEEECKKWRELLAANEAKIKIICGETILLAMTLVYGCSHGEGKRASLREKWRDTCTEVAGIPTSPDHAALLNDFFTDRYVHRVY